MAKCTAPSNGMQKCPLAASGLSNSIYEVLCYTIRKLGERMITIKDIAKKKSEFEANEKDVNKNFHNFLVWLGDNQHALDAESLEYMDRVINNFLKLAEKNLSERPDTPENRKLYRTAQKGLGEHWKIDQFFKVFDQPQQDQDDLYIDWFNSMSKSMQTICDYLFDVRQKKITGHEVVCFSLLTACVDELIAYVQLSKYRYSTQANAHLRTVYESIELVELFMKHPELISDWFSKKWQDRTQFAARNVRKKLGYEKHDEVYKFLCEHGTHATSESFSHRTMQGATEDIKGTAFISVGGTKRVDVRVNSHTFGIIIAGMVIGSIIDTFTDRLNHEEVENDLKSLFITTKHFFTTHFVPWAANEGLETDDITKEFEGIFTEMKFGE